MLNKTGFYANSFLATPEGQQAIGIVNQTHPHVANMLQHHAAHHMHFMNHIVHKLNSNKQSNPFGTPGGQSNVAGGSGGF